MDFEPILDNWWNKNLDDSQQNSVYVKRYAYKHYAVRKNLKKRFYRKTYHAVCCTKIMFNLVYNMKNELKYFNLTG